MTDVINTDMQVNTNELARMASEAGSMLYIILIVAVVILILVALIMYLRYKKSFKHTIVLREKTKGSTDKIYIDTYRYIFSASEAEKIQLWSTKEFKPCPPDAAKDFKTNGLEYCEGYISTTGELNYVNIGAETIDLGKFKEVAVKVEPNVITSFVLYLLSKVKQKPRILPESISYIQQSDKPKGEITFKALDTEDKEFYANSYFQAQRFKKKSIMQWITENIGMILLVFIFIMIFAFWAEITKPMIEVSARLAAVSENQAILMDRVEALVNQRQIIEADKAGLTNGTKAPN